MHHHYHVHRRRRGVEVAVHEEGQAKGILQQHQQILSLVGGRAPIPEALPGDIETVLPMVRGGRIWLLGIYSGGRSDPFGT